MPRIAQKNRISKSFLLTFSFKVNRETAQKASAPNDIRRIVARLADGTIDAMFVTAGLHADALEQLAKTCAIRLLSVDGGVGARLLAAYPAYRACVIPAGTYAGQGRFCWRRTRCPTRPSKG